MNQIEKAVIELKNGNVVAIPTETVYGLAANAADDSAITKIYTLKNRPSFNPLIIHVPNLEAAEEIAVFNKDALELAKKYWPGGLTMVLPKRDKNFALLATAGLDTVALRVPAHPIAHEIIKECGLPIAAPSANLSGTLSSTTAEHVRKNFPHIYIVDGGKCDIGLESTVVTFNGNEVVLLRAGVLQIPSTTDYSPHNKIISPGQLIKHYSPKNALRINADTHTADEIFIGFGEMNGDFNLSKTGNLSEAAANLFALLHEADVLNKRIAVARIPNQGIGIAINDRLSRAAEK